MLKLPTLEARLLGVGQRKTIGGPGGSKTTKGKFLTFDLVGNKRAAKLGTDGNLDCVNLGDSVSPLEPEGLFYGSEYGVIRTYQ